MGEVTFFLGLGLERYVDYSTVALLERLTKKGEWDAVNFRWRGSTSLRLRYLERMPQGTPYPEVVDRVRQFVLKPDLLGRCQVTVDTTGVGQAVIDMIEMGQLGCDVRRVKITSGETERYADGYYRVPKQDLIARVQVLLQSGGLEFANGVQYGERLLREMAQMRVKMSRSGREQFEARSGEHDDLALTLAMACWGAGKVPAPAGCGALQREYPFYGPGRIV